MKEIFHSPDPAIIYPRLAAMTQQEIVENNTLLILDEIQECPNARTAVKFLIEDGRLDIIETGSLLGVSIQDVKSYPVGFEMIIPMYPMTFLEFLWALNIPESTIENLFKLYLCDTGLLCRMMGGLTSVEILKGNIEINLGGVLENAFAQVLKSRNFNLFYFDSKRNYELDFLIQNKSQIDLLEIKSGKYYTKHASLDKALNNPDWQFGEAVVFCKGNVKQEERILYLPLYMYIW